MKNHFFRSVVLGLTMVSSGTGWWGASADESPAPSPVVGTIERAEIAEVGRLPNISLVKPVAQKAPQPSAVVGEIARADFPGDLVPSSRLKVSPATLLAQARSLHSGLVKLAGVELLASVIDPQFTANAVQMNDMLNHWNTECATLMMAEPIKLSAQASAEFTIDPKTGELTPVPDRANPPKIPVREPVVKSIQAVRGRNDKPTAPVTVNIHAGVVHEDGSQDVLISSVVSSDAARSMNIEVSGAEGLEIAGKNVFEKASVLQWMPVEQEITVQSGGAGRHTLTVLTTLLYDGAPPQTAVSTFYLDSKSLSKPAETYPADSSLKKGANDMKILEIPADSSTTEDDKH